MFSETHKITVVSSAYLTEKDSTTLHDINNGVYRNIPISVSANEYAISIVTGYFSELKEGESPQWAVDIGLSQYFIDIMIRAHQEGFYRVEFDRDGPITSNDFPIHDW